MKEDCDCSFCKEKVDEYFCEKCGLNFNECEVRTFVEGIMLCPKCDPFWKKKEPHVTDKL